MQHLGQKIHNVLGLKYILRGSCISFEGASSEGPSQMGFFVRAKLTSDGWEPSVLTPGDQDTLARCFAGSEAQAGRKRRDAKDVTHEHGG